MKKKPKAKKQAFEPAFSLPSPCEMQALILKQRLRDAELANLQLQAHIDGLEHALRAMSTPLS